MLKASERSRRIRTDDDILCGVCCSEGRLVRIWEYVLGESERRLIEYSTFKDFI